MSTAISKARNKTKEIEKTQAGIDSVTRGSLIAMGVVSALIGLWAVACLVSAFASGGGLVEMTQGWFSALTGR